MPSRRNTKWFPISAFLLDSNTHTHIVCHKENAIIYEIIKSFFYVIEFHVSFIRGHWHSFHNKRKRTKLLSLFWKDRFVWREKNWEYLFGYYLGHVVCYMRKKKPNHQLNGSFHLLSHPARGIEYRRYILINVTSKHCRSVRSWNNHLITIGRHFPTCHGSSLVNTVWGWHNSH